METSMGLLHSKDMRIRHTESVEKRSYQAPREMRPHVLLQIPRNAKFNTKLFVEQRVAICSENCDANVNKILLINSAANERVTCSSGDNGLCKVRDMESLTVKRNSSCIVTSGNKQVEQGLTVSAEKDYPSQSHLNKNSTHISIATTPPSGFSVNVDNKPLCISMWTLNPFSKSSDLYLNRDNYSIRYVASFRTGHYSFFFTNQIKLQNQANMVSKVIRINHSFAKPFQSYTDFVIECQDNTGKSYTILKMATLIQIDGTPTVAAIFATSSDDGSILFTKPLADINKQTIDSWINFMNRTCSKTSFKSYLEQSINCNVNLVSHLFLLF
ncbi:hypothetical protein DPMN_162916 [Dreissena polymorpha]|uniref:Uncharacterized protein n=1 Tax=Dreissena polymorpha TaxID=45954 RepID=A0A9D4EVM2_DREPO|nr:hypothetical protein DPMN_162916 [Dreissena polymorpha]